MTVNCTTTSLLALIALATTAVSVSAQQRSHYDATGKSLGRAQSDSQGTITFYDAGGKVTGRTFIKGKTATTYDADGRVISRATTTGKHKTIYDPAGRNVGKVTTSPQQ